MIARNIIISSPAQQTNASTQFNILLTVIYEGSSRKVIMLTSFFNSGVKNNFPLGSAKKCSTKSNLKTFYDSS